MIRAALLVLFLAAPAAAQFGPANPGRATVAVAAEHPVVTAGQTTTVAVTFTMDPGWHIYWLNAGGTGSPTELKLSHGKGLLTIGDPVWPGPTRYVQKAIKTVDFVYEGTATVLVPVTISKAVAAGTTLEVKVAARWFACDPETCVDGKATPTVTLTVAAKAPAVDAKRKARFDGYRKRMPEATPKEVKAAFEGAVLVIDAPKATRLAWFPLRPQTCDPVDSLKDGEAKGSRLKVRYPADVVKQKALTGLLAITRGKATTYHWLTVKPKASKPTK